MTTSDSDIGFIYPSASGSVQQTKDPISTTSPPNATTAVNVPGFPGYTTCGHTSSPVDSTFSGSSTPSFASLSPSLSHSSNSETSVSCESSRATSPSALTHESNSGASHHHTDRKKRLSVSESSIIRARKLSTSSTSSTGSTSKRRMSTLRESTAKDTLSSPTATTPTTTTLSHQCPQCGLCFAGPAVLVRHIESIHDKLLWNCMGCKSNLSRRDAVTRHINLSPMDSICRAVGTIGQIKMLDGSEVHYEISTYRAKPLEEVMGRMGARRGSVSGPSMAGSVPAKEFDRVKMEPQEEEDIDADGMEEIEYGFVSCRTQEEEEEGSGCVGRDERKKRRRSSVASIGRKKKY
ncbi:hypothetical protein BGZ74_003711 [Mortierella antarctica]|nr:hypothetical protein BGZ74_003711 [Mortierella antarctica]